MNLADFFRPDEKEFRAKYEIPEKESTELNELREWIANLYFYYWFQVDEVHLSSLAYSKIWSELQDLHLAHKYKLNDTFELQCANGLVKVVPPVGFEIATTYIGRNGRIK